MLQDCAIHVGLVTRKKRKLLCISSVTQVLLFVQDNYFYCSIRDAVKLIGHRCFPFLFRNFRSWIVDLINVKDKINAIYLRK